LNNNYEGDFEMADIDKLVEDLSKLSVLEAAQLVKSLRKPGVSPLPRRSNGCCCAPQVAAVLRRLRLRKKDRIRRDHQRRWSKKIEVIKTIRQLTSLEPERAKEMAETVGGKVLEAVSKEAANDAGASLSCRRRN
jgi:large subunit ribosomal protein L7/L12